MSRSQTLCLIISVMFFCGCGGGGPVEPANPSAPPGTGALKQSESNTTSRGNAKSIQPFSGN